MTTVEIPYSTDLDWPDALQPFDPLSLQIQAEPYAHYRWMRENAPVLRTRAGDIDLWCVTRYQDVRDALRAPKVFSSLVVDPPPILFLSLFDQPEHTRLRQTAAASFTPKAVAFMHEQIGEYADTYLSHLLAGDHGDVVREFALPLTMATISRLLGIPETDFDQIKKWSVDLSNYFGRVARNTPGGDGDEQGTIDFYEYMKQHMVRLAAAPDESVGSNLAAQWTSGRLTLDEAGQFAALLYFGGHDTTTILIANAFLTFSEHPELLPRLRENPEQSAAFIEELARYRGTIQRITRITTQPVTIAGTDIPEGSRIKLFNVSANRDEAKYPHAETFDMDRDPSGHFGFGAGVHTCLGAHLSRMESRIAVETVARAIHRVDLDHGAAIEYSLGGHMANTGPEKLMMSFARR